MSSELKSYFHNLMSRFNSCCSKFLFPFPVQFEISITVLPEGTASFPVFLPRCLHVSLMQCSCTRPPLYRGKSTAVFWTRYYLSNKDASSLYSILFSVSSRQSILEYSVLNLRFFITNKPWIKPIIDVRYKTDNTENCQQLCIIYSKKNMYRKKPPLGQGHSHQTTCVSENIQIIAIALDKVTNLFLSDDRKMAYVRQLRVKHTLRLCIVYLSACVGCNACYMYVGKTAQHFSAHVRENLVSDEASHIFKHPQNSEHCRRALCSVDCFHILDHTSTSCELKIKGISYSKRTTLFESTVACKSKTLLSF